VPPEDDAIAARKLMGKVLNIVVIANYIFPKLFEKEIVFNRGWKNIAKQKYKTA
jgi:hypothetical protein